MRAPLAFIFLGITILNGWARGDFDAGARFSGVAIDTDGDVVATGAIVGEPSGHRTRYSFGGIVLDAYGDDRFAFILVKNDNLGNVRLAQHMLLFGPRGLPNAFRLPMPWPGSVAPDTLVNDPARKPGA